LAFRARDRVFNRACGATPAEEFHEPGGLPGGPKDDLSFRPAEVKPLIDGLERPRRAAAERFVHLSR
jgi:hypothetical protein